MTHEKLLVQKAKSAKRLAAWIDPKAETFDEKARNSFIKIILEYRLKSVQRLINIIGHGNI